MPSKRKSIASFQNSQNASKRQRPGAGNEDDEGSSSKFGTTSAKMNQDYGQRGAFPGLDEGDGDGENMFYGPANDGLEYLRMVRSEAETVPRVVFAPKVSRQEEMDITRLEESEASGNWYSDGAYAAEPVYDEEYNSDELDAQEEYYKTLLKRFYKLREALSLGPPSDDGSSVSVQDALRLTARRAQWDYCFRQTPPKARTVAAASQEDVVRALTRLEIVLTKRNLLDAKSGDNISAWSWSLLARCRDVGQMSSEHISVIRDLGKTALVVRHKIKSQTEGRDDLEHVETLDAEEEQYEPELGGSFPRTVKADGGEVTNGAFNGASDHQNQTSEIPTENGQDPSLAVVEEDVKDLEKRRQMLLESLSKKESPDQPEEDVGGYEAALENINELTARADAAIDIIVTLVGEVFGQRDLLGARDVWD